MALADDAGTITALPPAPVPENLRVDPAAGTSPLPVGTSSPSDTPPPVTTVGGVQGPIWDTTPWYRPAVPSAEAAAGLAAAGPFAGQPGPANPFAGSDFPTQAPGAFVAPIGGGVAARGMPAGYAGGLLTVNLGGGAVSSSSHEQLAALPYAPHAGVRPGLGGIGRVLAGLGLAGPHRLPRELERHASHRTPLTP